MTIINQQKQGWPRIERINTDYKRQTWKIWAELFKMHKLPYLKQDPQSAVSAVLKCLRYSFPLWSVEIFTICPELRVLLCFSQITHWKMHTAVKHFTVRLVFAQASWVWDACGVCSWYKARKRLEHYSLVMPKWPIKQFSPSRFSLYDLD